MFCKSPFASTLLICIKNSFQTSLLSTIVHFALVYLVTWPMYESEAGVDQTFLLREKWLL